MRRTNLFPLLYKPVCLMIMMTQADTEFRTLYPLRNHSSLIFIFAITDSKGLTNNCLDFFFPPLFLCCCTENQPSDEQRERWMFLKMSFLISGKQQGSLFPSRTLELISTLVEGIFNMSAPCKAALPCWWLAHTHASSAPLLLRKLLWGAEALIDWRLSPQDASIIIISTSAKGRGYASRGSGPQPLFCVPNSQLEAAHCRRRVGCRVNCRGPNSWLYQGPLCLQQLSRQLRPGCNRWLISPVPDDTSISTRQVLFRRQSCLWPPSFLSALFYSQPVEVRRSACHKPWLQYLQGHKQ